ncbi:MAG: hypothetical protein CMJ89_01325 [Planctomycetes bacterium]|jgi:SAM-dependent methyltransferase|nr:hypothetical protein [Planctomycetota bacterium]
MEANAYRQFRELERTHWWFRGRRTVYFGILRRQLNGERPRRILDLGCGLGGFLDGLSEIGERVYPSDISAESLIFCRERGHDGAVVSNGYKLPYANSSLDLVCLFDTIEHIPDDARVMQEVERILRPGGRVLITVPAYQFLYANNDRVAQHCRRYNRHNLRRVIEQAGIQVERNTHSNIFLFPLILSAVLCVKLIETIFPRKLDPEHTNLSWPLPSFVHGVLHAIFAAELPFSRRFDWPVGHSICAIGRKP